MNILFIGDIIGRPGRQAVKEILPKLKKKYQLDAVIANGENLASGLGMTLETYEEMREAGIDYFTSGNHIWQRRQFIPYLDDKNINVIRPLNYPQNVPGRGFAYLNIGGKKILLANLIGRAFFNEKFDDPFVAMEKLLVKEKADMIIVDYHAEATSEKMIMGHWLDGQVQAVIGTHTHVPTADAMILPKGTAYITDVGMVGPLHASIGGDLATFLEADRKQIPISYKVGSGDVVFSAVLIKFNDKNQAEKIELIREIINKQESD